MSALQNKVVPVGMFGLGMASGFILRDELNMPTYMRIKMALVEHSILTRKKLNFDILQDLDPNQGKGRLLKQQEKTMKEHEQMLKQLQQKEANSQSSTDTADGIQVQQPENKTKQ